MALRREELLELALEAVIASPFLDSVLTSTAVAVSPLSAVCACASLVPGLCLCVKTVSCSRLSEQRVSTRGCEYS